MSGDYDDDVMQWRLAVHGDDEQPIILHVDSDDEEDYQGITLRHYFKSIYHYWMANTPSDLLFNIFHPKPLDGYCPKRHHLSYYYDVSVTRLLSYLQYGIDYDQYPY